MPSLKSVFMKKMNRKIIFAVLFICIVVATALTRLYKLDQYPPQLNRDEAALALNALYIKQAGIDEWGKQYPLQFKSFGDYKLPGYVYILSGFFHLSESDYFVRLPSAISGILLVFFSGFWIKSLHRKKIDSLWFIFFAASIVTAPFALFYSRMAWEANVALMFMIAALLLLHNQTPSWKKDLCAVALYSISVLTYNSPFLLLPFFIVSLPIIRGIRLYKNWILPVTLLTCVFISALLILSKNNTQKSDILFFTDANVLAQYPQYRAGLPKLLVPFVGSKAAYFTGIAVSHYKDTFLPEFLVIHGGQHPWQSILGKGHLFWTTYVLFLVGLIAQIWQVLVICKQIKNTGVKKIHAEVFKIIPLFFLIISPLPAIFTTDAPHATRSLFTLLMIIVCSAIGFDKIVTLLNKQKGYFKLGFITLVFILLLSEFARYLFQYFVLWPKNFSPDFQLDLFPELAKVTREHPDGNIAIIDLGWYLYAQVAWYQKIPAQVAISTIKRSGPDIVGLYRVHQIGRFYFVYHDDEPVPDKQGLITRDEHDGHWKLGM
jgi:cell division protein FtsL